MLASRWSKGNRGSFVASRCWSVIRECWFPAASPAYDATSCLILDKISPTTGRLLDCEDRCWSLEIAGWTETDFCRQSTRSSFTVSGRPDWLHRHNHNVSILFSEIKMAVGWWTLASALVFGAFLGAFPSVSMASPFAALMAHGCLLLPVLFKKSKSTSTCTSTTNNKYHSVNGRRSDWQMIQWIKNTRYSTVVIYMYQVLVLVLYQVHTVLYPYRYLVHRISHLVSYQVLPIYWFIPSHRHPWSFAGLWWKRATDQDVSVGVTVPHCFTLAQTFISLLSQVRFRQGTQILPLKTSMSIFLGNKKPHDLLDRVNKKLLAEENTPCRPISALGTTLQVAGVNLQIFTTYDVYRWTFSG